MGRAALTEYLFAAAAIAAATIASWAAYPFLHPTNLVMIYILGTLAVAARGHRGPAAAACVLSVLAFDFFFVPPRFTFTVADAQYILTFLALFATAMVTSHLTIRLRAEAAAAREGERRTSLMYSLTQQLSGLRTVDLVLRVGGAYLEQTFGGDVSFFVGETNGNLRSAVRDSKPSSEKEMGVAQWVFQRGEAAGFGTEYLPMEEALFLPLRGAQGCSGVIKFKPRDGLAPKRDQRQLLESIVQQLALALEVCRLDEKNKRTEIEAETERLRSALLSSVSHDFRTPLTAIVGSASTLLGKDEIRTSPMSRDLVENIQEEGERLSRLVQNLLETTRLESGRVRLKKELYPIEEVIGTALEHISARFNKDQVKVDVPEDFPPVPLDAVLIEQVFINLIENAFRHSPPGGIVRVSADRTVDMAELSVADSGPGIKESDLERVFEKFYRETSSTGAGLGLAICRAVATAHGGRIWAENRAGGGAVFRFTLPLETSNVA